MHESKRKTANAKLLSKPSKSMVPLMVSTFKVRHISRTVAVHRYLRSGISLLMVTNKASMLNNPRHR
jgi:hypothetical protein